MIAVQEIEKTNAMLQFFDQEDRVKIRSYLANKLGDLFIARYSARARVSVSNLNKILEDYQVKSLFDLNFADTTDYDRVSMLNDRVIVKIGGEEDWIYNVTFYYSNPDKHVVEEFIAKLKLHHEEASTMHHIHFIENNSYGELTLREREYTDKIEIDFDNYYNDSFDHEHIISELAANKSGLILLGGKPGTGKTSYIKWLLGNVERTIVYLPSFMTASLEDPKFLGFTMNRLKDCILVIEDAENVLKSRNLTNNPAVSTILNLTDGIMGSLTNITVLATYNTKDSIDTALFREGRLIYEHNFQELTVDKCNAISEKLGLNHTFTKPHTLAEVMNINNKNGKDENKPGKIGF